MCAVGIENSCVFLSFLDMFSNILTKHLLTFIIRLKWNSSFWSFQILLFDLFRTIFLAALLALYSPLVVTSLLHRVAIIKHFFMFNSMTLIQYFDQFAKICKPEHSFYRTRVRSLFTLVTRSMTHSLTDSLLFSKLDWCDPGEWRCQLKTCWGCYCCWCWCWG